MISLLLDSETWYLELLIFDFSELLEGEVVKYLYYIGIYIVFLFSCGDLDESTTFFGETDKKLFDDWTQQLVKDCSVYQIFPKLARQEMYRPRLFVDSRVLFEKTGGTSTLTGNRGDLIVFGSPTLLDADAVSDTTEEVDSRLFANLNDQNECVVRLDGQEIYRAPFYFSVPVITYFNSAVMYQTATLAIEFIQLNAQDSKIEIYGNLNQGFYQEFLDFQGHPGDLYTLLEEIFNYDTADLSSNIKFRPEVPDIAKLNTQGFQTWFSPSPGRLFGPTNILTDLFEWNSPQSSAKPIFFEATYYYSIPVIENNPYYRSTNQDLLGIDVELNFSNRRDVYDGSIRYFDTTITKVAVGQVRGDSERDAIECVEFHLSRISFLAQPSVVSAYDVFRPCRSLAVDIYDVVFKNIDVRRAIMKHIMESQFPTHDYLGWDTVARTFLLMTDQQAMETIELFIGINASRKIDNLIKDIQLLRTSLTTSLQANKYREAIITLPLNLLFLNQTPPKDFLRDLIRTFELFNSKAYTQVLQDLMADFDEVFLMFSFEEGVNKVACAKTYSVDILRAFETTIQRVETNDSLRVWVNNYLSSLLSSCPSESEISSLGIVIDDAFAFAQAENLRTDALNSRQHSSSLSVILNRGMEERWTASIYDDLGRITEYISVSSRYGHCNKGSYAQRAVCAELSGLRTLSFNGMLLPLYSGRYGQLAQQLSRIYTDGLSQELTLATIVEEAFFANFALLWQQCSNDEFGRKQQTLMNLLNNYKAASLTERIGITDDILAHLSMDCSI